MVNSKKGLLVFLFFVLVSSAYSDTSVNLTLDNEKSGPESVFSGALSFSFTEDVPLAEPFVFHIGSSTTTLTLEEVLEAGNFLDDVTILQERYGAGVSSVSVDMTGSGVEAGFDLRGNPANPRNNLDVRVEEARFKVKAGNSNVNNPRIKIGERLVYQYRGSETGWSQLERNHLGTFSTEGLSIKFISGNVYCQLLNVTGSEKYKLKAVVKKHNTNYDLNLSIGDESLAFPECNNAKCCTISNSAIGTSLGEVNCEVEREIPETREQYVCAYASSPNPIEGDSFSIRANNDLSFSRGQISGMTSEWNFYLYGDYRTYNNILSPNTADDVMVDPNLINEYITMAGCTSQCLIIPLELIVDNNAPVTFRELVLNYNVGVAAVEDTQFRRISVIPRSARSNREFSADLESLGSVKTPATLGDDYDIYASFYGVNSESAEFDVVPAPTAFIRYGPFNPGVGESVRFDGSSSTPVSGRSITSYVWGLGDGTTKTGAIVTHSYNRSGYYPVRLKVVDSEGVAGIDTSAVRVTNQSTGTAERIERALDSIGSFRLDLSGGTQKARDVAGLLSLTNLMEGYEFELQDLAADYNQILNNATLNDSRKTLFLSAIGERVDEIESAIPASFGVDTTSFSSGVSGISQIPACCEFTTEEARRKVLAYQRQATVNAEAYTVSVEYADGTAESFMVIKKNVVGSGLKIYETLPSGMRIDEVLSGGNFTSPSPNVYAFTNTNQITYRTNSASLRQALETKTILLPADLASIEAEGGEEEIRVLSECGNNICELDEDAGNCPEDCKPSRRGIYLGALVVLIIAGLVIYFGFFFKGGLFRKFVKPKDSRHMFKNERDYYSVAGFVNRALDKKLGRDTIKSALKSKGWKEQQIQGVFEDLSKSRQMKHR